MMEIFFNNPVKCILTLILIRLACDSVMAVIEERQRFKSWNFSMLGLLAGLVTGIAILVYNIYISAN